MLTAGNRTKNEIQNKGATPAHNRGGRQKKMIVALLALKQ